MFIYSYISLTQYEPAVNLYSWTGLEFRRRIHPDAGASFRPQSRKIKTAHLGTICGKKPSI